MHIIQPDFVATQLILFDNFKLKLCEIFYIPLNSSTIDELGEGAWKDGGASSTGAERVG